MTLKEIAELMLNRLPGRDSGLAKRDTYAEAYHALAMEILFAGHKDEAFHNFANRLEAGDWAGARAWANQIKS